MSEYRLHIKTVHTELYSNHKAAYSGDSGIDIFHPNEVCVAGNSTVIVDLEIQCEMKALHTGFNLGDTELFINKSYLLVPRSSISKTPLRMANSIGIIDSGYRGNIKVAIDNIRPEPYIIKKGERLFQIIAADLNPIIIKLVETVSDSDRRAGGFGSSGVFALPTNT